MLKKIIIAELFFFTLFLLLTCKYEHLDPYDFFPVDTDFQKITDLSEDIPESSGIELINGSLWTHNDSGDGPFLHEISTTDNERIRTVILQDAEHKDYEDITADADFVYVGDFGNNSGNRQDLRIYRFSKIDLQSSDTISVSEIRFDFSDQSDFDNETSKHNFDCEAMIAVEDSLYLFSKSHADEQTKLYRLPKVPGANTAELIGQYDTQGLITGAALAKESSTLCLLGYNIDQNPKTFKPFVWIFYEYPERQFFRGKHKRINLPVFTQTEGICYQSNGRFYISSEREEGTEAALFIFDADKWK